MSRFSDLRVKPGSKVRLGDHDPGDRLGYEDKAAANAATAKHSERLRELTAKLAATRAKAVLLVLQGMDCSGKDGTTRAAFAEVSPTLPEGRLVQGADSTRARARLPLARAREPAGARPDRRVQPLALRGRAGRPRRTTS